MLRIEPALSMDKTNPALPMLRMLNRLARLPPQRSLLLRACNPAHGHLLFGSPLFFVEPV
jgi:hypothetical protein